MNNEEHGFRATGDYAIYGGREYFALDADDRIWLFTDDDPLPSGFDSSSKDWVRGEKLVPTSHIQRLMRVRTNCIWRGHRFKLGIIVNDVANVVYLGSEFDEVSGLPGMTRPDKYEVRGRVPVSQLVAVEEHVEEVPLGDRANHQKQSRGH